MSASQSLRGQLEEAQAEVAALKQGMDAGSADLEALRTEAETATQALESKEVALNEAYARAVHLQQAVQERDEELDAARLNIAELKSALADTSTEKVDLESRLQQTRADVAGEMAVLTSTMIKMKEDALAAAKAEIETLQGTACPTRTGRRAC